MIENYFHLHSSAPTSDRHKLRALRLGHLMIDNWHALAVDSELTKAYGAGGAGGSTGDVGAAGSDRRVTLGPITGITPKTS